MPRIPLRCATPPIIAAPCTTGNFAWKKPRGEHFKWPRTTTRAPTISSAVFRLIDDEPAVVVVYGRTAYVDDATTKKKTPLGVYEHEIPPICSMPAESCVRAAVSRFARQHAAVPGSSGWRDVLLPC